VNVDHPLPAPVPTLWPGGPGAREASRSAAALRRFCRPPLDHWPRCHMAGPPMIPSSHEPQMPPERRSPTGLHRPLISPLGTRHDFRTSKAGCKPALRSRFMVREQVQTEQGTAHEPPDGSVDFQPVAAIPPHPLLRLSYGGQAGPLPWGSAVAEARADRKGESSADAQGYDDSSGRMAPSSGPVGRSEKNRELPLNRVPSTKWDRLPACRASASREQFKSLLAPSFDLMFMVEVPLKNRSFICN
jgi:hypothetical protein